MGKMTRLAYQGSPEFPEHRNLAFRRGMESDIFSSFYINCTRELEMDHSRLDLPGSKMFSAMPVFYAVSDIFSMLAGGPERNSFFKSSIMLGRLS
jgi:hypothetical protein